MPTFPAIAALWPVAAGAVALGCGIYERARDDRRVGEVSSAAATLSALALFLIALQPMHAERVVAAGVACALWLAGRARTAPRLAPLLLVSVGLLAGTRPIVGLALGPFVVRELVRVIQQPLPLRATTRALFVLIIAMLVGHVAFGTAPFARGSWTAWLSEATSAVGVAAIVVALAGIALALTGERARSTALSVGLLVLGEMLGGRAGALTTLAISIGVALAILESSAHLVRAPRGATLALGPLIALVLVEPLALRADSMRATDWTLGPVPPRTSLPQRTRGEHVPR